jgi:hypothetical protein
VTTDPDDPRALREVIDPLARARQASEAQERLRVRGLEVSRVRRESLEELLRGGMSQAAIGSALGMSRARVGQLLANGPPPERHFFGDDRITVAMGAKYEAGKEHPGRVLAQEDSMTFTAFQHLLAAVELEAEAEVIPQPGVVLLNRPNLVVVCGPRLSPMLGQILASDPHLAFGSDEQGWYLQDRNEGTVFRVVENDPATTDYAYFGRLPRPDGQGFFTYIAGIHAAGPAGVVHWLQSHLGHVYREVRQRRFSTVISCRLDPTTRAVIQSDRVSPVYLS